MYLIPLNQLESVELVIHSLKMAAGEADCTTCPAYKVCMKQCLTIAGAVENMLFSDSLPQLERPDSATDTEQIETQDTPEDEPPKGSSHLSIVK